MQKFIIRGKTFTADKKKIADALNGIEPELINKYYIEINSRKYPIKQAITQAFGIPKLGFTSMDAYNILRKLGFEIKTL